MILWDNVLTETSVNNWKAFANGEISGRQLVNLQPSAGKLATSTLLRRSNTKRLRRASREALRRRNLI